LTALDARTYQRVRWGRTREELGSPPITSSKLLVGNGTRAILTQPPTGTTSTHVWIGNAAPTEASVTGSATVSGSVTVEVCSLSQGTLTFLPPQTHDNGSTISTVITAGGNISAASFSGRKRVTETRRNYQRGALGSTRGTGLATIASSKVMVGNPVRGRSDSHQPPLGQRPTHSRDRTAPTRALSVTGTPRCLDP
jgi:hypothetical protein